MAAQLRVTTVAMLPPVLRERLDLPLSSREERAFRAFCAASRAAGPVIRGPLCQFGPMYVKYRAAALARGDVAGHPPVRKAPERVAAA